MLVILGYIMLAGMVIVLVWGLCVEARDMRREFKAWLKGGK